MAGVDDAEVELRALRAFGSRVPELTARAVRRRIDEDAKPYLAPAEPARLDEFLAERRREGLRVNVNHLGEEVLGEADAARMLEKYLELLGRPGVDTISVKLSSIDSRIDLVAWDATLERLSNKLALIYRAALDAPGPKLVYLDMEAYDITNKACNDAVLAYVRSFTKTLRGKVYRAGYYGFTSSSAKAIATATNKTDLPGNLWYALYDGKDTTTADWPWGKDQFTGHSRGHQYTVNSKEKRGGYTITVDRNAWDAPVAIVG